MSDRVEVVVKRESIGVGGILLVLFVALKLLGVIDWSWWWVLAPIWIPLAVWLVVVVIIAVVALAGACVSKLL